MNAARANRAQARWRQGSSAARQSDEHVGASKFAGEAALAKIERSQVYHAGSGFLDQGGDLFPSLRRESDDHSNLFSKPLANTKLSRPVHAVDEINFIDNELYPPSDELAAFFSVPVFDSKKGIRRHASGEHIGWIVLQRPLNKLDAILSGHQRLGGARGSVLPKHRTVYGNAIAVSPRSD